MSSNRARTPGDLYMPAILQGGPARGLCKKAQACPECGRLIFGGRIPKHRRHGSTEMCSHIGKAGHFSFQFSKKQRPYNKTKAPWWVRVEAAKKAKAKREADAERWIAGIRLGNALKKGRR